MENEVEVGLGGGVDGGKIPVVVVTPDYMLV